MATYEYVAIDNSGKRISGTLEAASAAQAAVSLKRRELKPVHIEVAKRVHNFGKLPGIGKKKRVKARDLVIFTRQLATMINAGVPLVRSLATLHTQTESESLKKHVSEITKDIEGGLSFADSLQKHSDVFSPIYINMVRAGEAGGILDEILKKLADQQEKDAKIRGKFKSAMTYPAILMTITLGVFMLLMVFVVPRIGRIIQDLAGEDAELPVMTKVMLSISDFMVSKWYIMIAGGFLISYFLRRYLKTPKGRHKRDEILLKIPVLKMIVKKVAIARFARIFSSLIGAGVTVIESIEVTAKAIGNMVIEDELMAASKEVQNGQQLSVPLSQSSVFPPIVSQMMAIGEETGQTDQILVKVAVFYEEEVDVTVDSLSSILEPIMIVIMGTMVGLIAASVIGPISNLSNQI